MRAAGNSLKDPPARPCGTQLCTEASRGTLAAASRGAAGREQGEEAHRFLLGQFQQNSLFLELIEGQHQVFQSSSSCVRMNTEQGGRFCSGSREARCQQPPPPLSNRMVLCLPAPSPGLTKHHRGCLADAASSSLPELVPPRAQRPLSLH